MLKHCSPCLTCYTYSRYACWPGLIPSHPGKAELAQKVVKAFTAKQHTEKLSSVHEVDVQPFHAMRVILGTQVCVTQDLQGQQAW